MGWKRILSSPFILSMICEDTFIFGSVTHPHTRKHFCFLKFNELLISLTLLYLCNFAKWLTSSPIIVLTLQNKPFSSQSSQISQTLPTTSSRQTYTIIPKPQPTPHPPPPILQLQPRYLNPIPSLPLTLLLPHPFLSSLSFRFLFHGFHLFLVCVFSGDFLASFGFFGCDEDLLFFLKGRGRRGGFCVWFRRWFGVGVSVFSPCCCCPRW